MSQTAHDRENLALVLALLRSYQVFIRSMGPIFRDAKLTSSQWDVLETLTRKGPLRINDLLDALLSTSGNIDVVIRNLVQAGLVDKIHDENDRRSRIVSLTSKGQKKANDFYPSHNAALGLLLGDLSRSEKRTLISLLNNFRKKITISMEDNKNDQQNAARYSCGNL